MPDRIHIENLQIQARIGVPDEERAHPQRLTVSVTLEPAVGFTGLEDRIENTIDYAAVCEQIKSSAASRPRSLVETFAQELAERLLAQFPIRHIVVEVRKFILTDTDYVAIRIERSRDKSQKWEQD
jgi:dihydroneopterin aldolase